jgi:hypothetical protein
MIIMMSSKYVNGFLRIQYETVINLTGYQNNPELIGRSLIVDLITDNNRIET